MIYELDLFSGIGGNSLALKHSIGARTVCHVERDPHAVGVLVSRMESGDLDHAPIWDDVCTFDGRPWRGIVDIISGGFPCQDISVAGKGAGIVEGVTRSGLWYEYARIIGEVRPAFVFIENVRALLTRGIDQVLRSLSEMGYDAEWGVVSAADAGAAHRRERIFILGYAKHNTSEPTGASTSRVLADPDSLREQQPGWTNGEERRRTFDCCEGVANSTRELLHGSGTISEESGGAEHTDCCRRSTQSELGGAAHGAASWMDMLRIAPPGHDQNSWEEPRLIDTTIEWRSERLKRLGNGVVPQQAALAIKLLNHQRTTP